MDFNEALQIAKPILFNDEMTLAIINQNKTTTRRVVKLRYNNTEMREINGRLMECIIDAMPTAAYSFECRSRYNVGDYLYVREAWRTDEYGRFIYRANNDGTNDKRWYPSIHMPKKAARIILQVIDVKATRLQDISNRDIICEGLERILHIDGSTDDLAMQTSFIRIWNSTINKTDINVYGWNANPWVMSYKFRLCDNTGTT